MFLMKSNFDRNQIRFTSKSTQKMLHDDATAQAFAPRQKRYFDLGNMMFVGWFFSYLSQQCCYAGDE